ncbi:MAG: class I SAM-dependent methyltransferase [Spirochaetota bacterium]
MKPYTTFSSVYDYVLKHVDYERWYSYIRSLMFRYIDNPKMLLELGCGTGKFGAKFSRDNFEIFGMDNSIEMLRIAKNRAYKKFHIFCSDMTNFTLSKKFDFIFSVHDTMNYFLEPDELARVFRSARRIMTNDSIFMFDITTEYNIKKYFFNNKTDYSVNGMEVEWENKYDAEKKIIYSILTFKQGSLIETETHIQRLYTIDEIKNILKSENYKLIDVFSDYSFNPVKENTVMINFISKIN